MNSTYSFAKAVSLTDYMPAFRQNSELQYWDWQKLYTMKRTNRGSEQVFSYNGLPVARKTAELEPIYYASMSENAATTFTVGKYTLATMFSREFLDDNQHLPDMMREAGSSAGDSHAFIKAQAAAAPFNRAFDSNYAMWDGVELCGTHTLKDGTSFDNDLTPASLTYDNLWLAVNAFETSLATHSGLYLRDTPQYLVYHPSYTKEVRAILETDKEPGTANNDKNTLRSYNLTPVPCRFLTTSTNWFVLGSRFKKDLIWLTRKDVATESEPDFDRQALKFSSTQRFANGVRDFIFIMGNPGA